MLPTEKSSWCRNEQGCQGVKRYDRSNGLDTCAIKHTFYLIKFNYTVLWSYSIDNYF